MTRQRSSFLQADDGQAMVLTAVCLLVLLMMAGLGVDVGYLRYQKQQMQKAADAAALAGAAAINYGGDFLTAAHNDSAANGFIDGYSGISVVVNNPPASGPYKDNTDYVEVIVAQNQATAFMRFGGFSIVNVRARAVAFSKASASGCIYVMDGGGVDSYSATGNTQVNTTCGILVNSTSSRSFLDSGAACTTASSIGLVGGIDQDACGTPPKSGIPRFTDPLNTLPRPTGWSCPHQPLRVPSGCSYGPGTGLTCNSGPVQIDADTYCGGITLTGGVRSATFGAGNYILAGGGMRVTGNVDLIGDGVMFFNTVFPGGPVPYQPINIIPGGDNTRLAAPTSGTYEGILFYQDRALSGLQLTNPNNVQGGRHAYFQGTSYFPTTPLRYSGGGATTSDYTLIVAYTLDLSGPNEFNSHYDSLSKGTSPIHSQVLVE